MGWKTPCFPLRKSPTRIYVKVLPQFNQILMFVTLKLSLYIQYNGLGFAALWSCYSVKIKKRRNTSDRSRWCPSFSQASPVSAGSDSYLNFLAVCLAQQERTCHYITILVLAMEENVTTPLLKRRIQDNNSPVRLQQESYQFR
jgi:hypothetical protein